MNTIYPVTDDPNVLRDLRVKLDELGSYEVVEYAYSLGLFPPGYEEGQKHTISEYWPPDYDEEDGLLVWDVGFDSPDPAQDQTASEPDASNPWEGFVATSMSTPDQPVEDRRDDH